MEVGEQGGQHEGLLLSSSPPGRGASVPEKLGWGPWEPATRLLVAWSRLVTACDFFPPCPGPLSAEACCGVAGSPPVRCGRWGPVAPVMGSWLCPTG